MIVVEGPDGAGKTTFIELLKAETGLSVAPRVVDKDTNAMVDLKAWVHENVSKGFQFEIFDRHRLISEPIYGPILRNPVQQLEAGFLDLSWFYANLEAFYRLKPIIIYCLPPFQTVWNNIMMSEDNMVFHKNGKAIHQIWAAYLNKASTDFALRSLTYVYDYTSDDPQYYIRHIKRALEKKRQDLENYV